MAAAVWLVYKGLTIFLGNAVSTLISIAIGAVVYFFMILTIKAITKDEIAKLPKGSKLVKIVNQFVK
jgi:stage V sporulation protein B